MDDSEWMFNSHLFFFRTVLAGLEPAKKELTEGLLKTGKRRRAAKK